MGKKLRIGLCYFCNKYYPEKRLTQAELMECNNKIYICDTHLKELQKDGARKESGYYPPLGRSTGELIIRDG